MNLANLFFNTPVLLIAVLFSYSTYAADFPEDISDNVKLSEQPQQVLNHLEANGPITPKLVNTWHSSYQASERSVSQIVSDLVSFPIALTEISVDGGNAFFITKNSNDLPIYCKLAKNNFEGLPEFHLLICTDIDLKTRLSAIEGINGEPTVIENSLDDNNLSIAEGFAKVNNEEIIKNILESSSGEVKSVLSDFFANSNFISSKNNFNSIGSVGSPLYTVSLFKILSVSGDKHSCAFVENNQGTRYVGCTEVGENTFSFLLAVGSNGSLLIKNTLN